MQNMTIDGYRLSPQQERLWLLHRAEGNTPFRAQCAVLAEGSLDAGALSAAMACVIQSNEILRTGFHYLEGMGLPVQVISESRPIVIEEHDLAGLDGETQDAVIGELMTACGKDFDFESDSLLRVDLARLTANRHMLILSLPSLCADRAGLENLVREIFSAYETQARGAKTLTNDHLQYVDISEWQNELLESEETSAGREFWRQRDISTLLEVKLPFEKPAEQESAFEPQAVAVSFDDAVTAKVKSLALSYEMTTSDILLACWQTLLWRLTGCAEIVTGVAHTCRTYEELNDALGLFARYLPVYSSFEQQTRFSVVARQCAESALDAGRWQSYFTWPRAADFSAADSSEAPFFPFAFEHAQSSAKLTGDGISFSVSAMKIHTEPFKIKLCCLESEIGMAVELQYDRHRYHSADIQRLSAQYERIVRSALDAPEAEIRALEIVTEAELRQVARWNDTAADYPASVCVHELCEAQAERTPDAVALVFEDSHLTYHELNGRANQLARYLRARGLGLDGPVGVMMERGVDIVLALLGVLKAGGAYVVLDADYPRERLSFMLDDTQPALILTHRNLLGKIPLQKDGRAPYQAASLDSEWRDIEGHSSENLCCPVTPDNLTCIIYTSGSTGQPKGVMISHRAVSNRLLWMQSVEPLTANDKLLQKTVLSFDASIWELFLPLIAGASLVVARPGGHQDSAYMADVIVRERITVLQLVPTMLQVFLEEPEVRKCQSLLRVFSGGEALSVELQRRFFERMSWSQLYNLYGPTETTIDVTHWKCEREGQRAAVPIGQPNGNTQLYILDEYLQIAPIGVAGELFVGGMGLARGYHRRPNLTAEPFIPNPFGQMAGERLYRTGDLARYMPDGSIEYLGRADGQVKLRGLRIELGEIEAMLAAYPGVQDAVVTVHEDDKKHKRLVGYVIPSHRPSNGAAAESHYRLPSGLEIAHLNRNETEIIYREIFDDLTYLRHGVSYKSGDCIFDVGANIGLFSLFVSHVCPDARIFAFEPIPATAGKLKANVALYDLNVTVYECGLSNESGSATFTFYPHMSGMSGRYADEGEDKEVTRTFLGNQDERMSAYSDELLQGRFEEEKYECRLRTVSEVIDEHGLERIDMLKIDVEKSELDVLNGIREPDWEKIKQAVIEVHDIDGRLERTRNLLAEHGFRVVVEQDTYLKSTGLYNVYATRPNEEVIEQEDLREKIGRGRRELAGRRGLELDDLRCFLQERLPDSMVPSHFVFLRSFPVTPNGKLDRRALPAPDLAQLECDDTYVAPRTPVEELLAAIWAQILGLSRVGIHDNFFSLGGDSILSIQIIARANQADLRLTPADLFAHQTIADLATVAGKAKKVIPDQGAVTGETPLTPAQLWFFEQKVPDRHHWNQAILLESRLDLDAGILETAVRQVATHHDALRLRFRRRKSRWEQFNEGPDAASPFMRVDLAGIEEGKQRNAIEETAAKLQKSLHVSEGPLARFVFFDVGAGKPGRFLILIHHLIVDGVSWRILLEDLQTAYRQLSTGGEIRLSSKTTSFKYWSRQLTEYAESPELLAEMDYWLDEKRTRAGSLPLDAPNGKNTIESARSVTVKLTAEETQALLQRVPQAFDTQINEVLLTQVVRALTRWTGEHAILIAMEGHGREEIIDGVDLSRTVGWFTTLFPVLFEARSGAESGELLSAVKEQLRRVPSRGIGYGVLKYLAAADEITTPLRSLPEVEISFNYLGQFDQVLSSEGLFSPAQESTGANISAGTIRPHVLEISGGIFGGRLHLDWTYSENLHQSSTIELLAREAITALRSLIECAMRSELKTLAPSNFPLARLDQKQLDRLIESIPEIEDIYPLSPLQEGMLFHTLYTPGSGMYLEQVSCAIHGDLDHSAFQQAWRQVMKRHSILRTAFVWKDLDQTLQVVSRLAEIPIEHFDWRGLARTEQQEQWNAYLLEDRRRGFDASRPPLMRLALAQIDDGTHYCMWTSHHLLIDGWCVPIILQEVFALYEALNNDAKLSLPISPPYRNYIGWLQSQSSLRPEQFWRQALSGFTGPTPLGGESDTGRAEKIVYEKRSLDLSVETTNALQAFARQRQLTLYTLVQGAWALVLSRHSGRADVVFGTIVSGRPVDLPDVETIVGPFINSLPVRVKIEPEVLLLDWLRELQAHQVEARQHEHSPLVQIQGWSEVSRGLPLFESLLTFENRPVGLTPQGQKSSVRIEDISHFNRNNLPLTIVANPNPNLALQASYDAGRFDSAVIERLLSRFRSTLEDILNQPNGRVGDLNMLEEAEAEKRSLREAESTREAAKFNRFKSTKPRSVELSPQSLVKQGYFNSQEMLPLVLEPAMPDIDPISWASSSREFISDELRKHGAILFRNFDLPSVAGFESFAEAIYPRLFASYGDLPREETSTKVYKSTPYPSDKTILFHNESSHMHRWPMKQWFYCATAAQEGGETPIVDCRRIYGLLDTKIAKRFADKRLMYVRNFIEGIDVSWQEFFKTSDKAAVEEYCRQAFIEFEWKEKGLKTRRVCQAVARHPATGERVFFNQIQLHHVSCLEAETRENMQTLFEEEDLPRNVYYGDGSPIENSIVGEICGLYQQNAVRFRWQAGDVLMVDNMLIAHGRNPFVGERKIVVAMGEMIGSEELQKAETVFAEEKES